MTRNIERILDGHHAYCIEGTPHTRQSVIELLEKKWKIRTLGNPDFFNLSYETMTIDDARNLKASALMKPVTDGAKKIFVISLNSITIEAENALLKLLEEPPVYVHIFLIISSAHLLLPTVRSRMQIVEDSDGEEAFDVDITREADLLLRSSKKERFDQIKSLMDAIAKEKQTKQHAIDLLSCLEHKIYAKGVVKNRETLQAIMLAQKYANDRAPSMKMLLEYVAMNV